MAKGKYSEWITESGLQLIEQWARDGLTEEQIAGNIGICRDTLNEWKNRFPAISDAIKKGKAPVDFQVENALLKRARGYEYNETRTDATGKAITITRHVPPDVVACIFWLKNRRPEKWREKPPQPESGKNDLLQSLYDLMAKGENRE